MGDGGPLRVLHVREEGSLRAEEGDPLHARERGVGGPGWMWGERHTKWMGFVDWSTILDRDKDKTL